MSLDVSAARKFRNMRLLIGLIEDGAHGSGKASAIPSGNPQMDAGRRKILPGRDRLGCPQSLMSVVSSQARSEPSSTSHDWSRLGSVIPADSQCRTSRDTRSSNSGRWRTDMN